MAFVSDTMTESDDVQLEDHTGETGATWTNRDDSGSNDASITSNRIRWRQGVPWYYASGSPATAEYDVEADCYVNDDTALDQSGILGRASTSADTGYMARNRQDTDVWDLFKIVGGSFTELGTYSQSLSASSTYALKLEIRDANKKVYIDGVPQITSTNNDITAAGKAGFRFRNANGIHFDNFTATDVATDPATVNNTIKLQAVNRASTY